MISVYLLLDLCPSPCPSPSPFPFPCLSPSPAQTPPQTPARPRLPSVPRARPPRRRNGAEMSPERVLMPRWATETRRSVPRACGNAPLGDGTGQKCRPSVW